MKGFFVANIKSQKKRNRTNEKARIRNKAIRSELKTVVKEVHKAVEAVNTDQAQKQMQRAARLLDKAVTKGVIHKNQAANRKHGIQVLVNDLKKNGKGASSASSAAPASAASSAKNAPAKKGTATKEKKKASPAPGRKGTPKKDAKETPKETTETATKKNAEEESNKKA